MKSCTDSEPSEHGKHMVVLSVKKDKKSRRSSYMNSRSPSKKSNSALTCHINLTDMLQRSGSSTPIRFDPSLLNEMQAKLDILANNDDIDFENDK